MTGAGDDIIIAGEDGELITDVSIDGVITTADHINDSSNGDWVDAGMGDNIVFGDNGRITASSIDAPQFGSQPITLGLLTTVSPAIGGNDTIYTGIGYDIIFGGTLNDTIVANAVSDNNALESENYDRNTNTQRDSDNIILGDNGFIDYTGLDRHAAGSTTIGYDLQPSDIDVISTTDPTIGGVDTITSGAGYDFIFGGTAGDTIHAGAGNDLVFGDHGKVEAVAESYGGVIARALPMSGGTDYAGIPQLAGLNGSQDPFTFTSIDTQNSDDGGDDKLYGQDGEDIVIGGQGNDLIYGGNDDDDLIGGHNVAGGQDGNDIIDGGRPADADPNTGNDTYVNSTDNDVIAGDNASILRQGNALSPRIRVLDGTIIYGDSNNGNETRDGQALVTDTPQVNPTGVEARTIVIYDHEDTPLAGTHGDDYIAGGAGDDVIFGEMGNDTIQGDGSIQISVSAQRPAGGTLTVAPSTEDFGRFDNGVQLIDTGRDGDDYIEGGDGKDVIFGNLGQDDIVGGSSNLFGLTIDTQRPDGEDFIFGGAGTDLIRSNYGDQSANGHARDADTILGDNGNIYRLVGVNGTPGVGTTGVRLGTPMAKGAFLAFNYDDYANSTLRLIPRATTLLDYIAGGVDFDPVNQPILDNGGPDEIHGESGDDTIYGMKDGDILFGEGQNDDIIGGYGNDWISGGTGIDGILGDDGRIYTSRNVQQANNNDTSLSEPLYGIAKVDQVDKTISTPGNIQVSVINPDHQLKKTVNLTPFNVQDPSLGMQEFLYNPQQADDIIYGGLGNDFLHGGAGDDAISGAEALPDAFVLVYPDDGQTHTEGDGTGEVINVGYNTPQNPGNVLGFEAYRAEEFAAYDEFAPMTKIQVYDSQGNGGNYFLNFDTNAGPAADNDPAVNSDGNDMIFGDLGNDWLVGGTGQDDLFGGYGNDLLNADDNQETDGGLNDLPDGPQLSYEDTAFGGAGRDVLIANTGGDRLIDWAGEFNSYLVPFAPFGLGTVSRSLQPALMDYLYNLSAGDGADPTRAADTGASPARNGEPYGELGLVKQQDADWQDQTGAPADPQPGNIPGGARDVLRGADFNNGKPQGFFVDSGSFTATGGRLEVAPDYVGGDAASVFNVVDQLPTYFEVKATINAGKPTAGLKSNAYIIFDYQSQYDFKFAGVNISTDKLEMGHRTVDGWIVDEQTNMQLKPNKDYDLLLALNGTVATLVVNGSQVFSHAYAPRVDSTGYSYGLNAGMVGLGANNSVARIDNVAIQVLPPEITYENVEDFQDGVADIYTGGNTGTWQVNSSDGNYQGTPLAGQVVADSLTSLDIGSNYLLQVQATLSTDTIGGIVFDHYGDNDYKFAAISTSTNQVLIGHYTYKHGWTIDAAVDINLDANTDYELGVSLKGTTVSVSLNNQAVLGYVYNAVTVDGDFGLLSRDGTTTFDLVTVSTNDPDYQSPQNILAAGTPSTTSTDLPSLTLEQLAPVVEAAIADWKATGLLSDADIATLDALNFQISDLAGLDLGQFSGNTITIDINAAGFGWFVDATPDDNVEFTLLDDGSMVAADGSAAAGLMDLLTVVAHEIGHVLGYSDVSSDGTVLMDASLETGVRLLPETELSFIISATTTSVDTTAVESSTDSTVTGNDVSITSDTTTTVDATASSTTDTAVTDSTTTSGDATFSTVSDTDSQATVTVTDDSSLLDTASTDTSQTDPGTTQLDDPAITDTSSNTVTQTDGTNTSTADVSLTDATTTDSNSTDTAIIDSETTVQTTSPGNSSNSKSHKK